MAANGSPNFRKRSLGRSLKTGTIGPFAPLGPAWAARAGFWGPVSQARRVVCLLRGHTASPCPERRSGPARIDAARKPMQSAQFQLHAEIETRHWWFTARRAVVRRLAAQLLPKDGQGSIVDVGCGTGANIAAFADLGRCLGVDASAEAIESARARFPQVEFRQGFAPELFADRAGQIDLLTLMDVLEHVPDDFEMLSALLGALKPGAHLLLTVPADERLWSQHDESFGHYRRYDARRLARVWEGLSVTPLLLSGFNARLYPLVRLARTVGRFRGRSTGEAGTDFWIPPAPLNRALEWIFAGEARRLSRAMREKRVRPYAHGVSLIAVLRREAGEIAVRERPADLVDAHQPSCPSPCDLAAIS